MCASPEEEAFMVLVGQKNPVLARLLRAMEPHHVRVEMVRDPSRACHEITASLHVVVSDVFLRELAK